MNQRTGGRIVLGVDGGGTRTRIAIVDDTGRVLGIGEAGPGNYHDVGAGGVRDNIAAALDQAWDAATCAGHSRRPAAAACLALASVVSKDDHAVIRDVARALELAPNEHIETSHDLRAALAGALAGKPGMVLVVGTGSACFGCDPSGNTWKAGGWGSRLDDGGSSTWLGLQAMIAAIRAEDGRARPTILTKRVLDVLKLSELRDLLKKVDAQGLTRRDIAQLAREVTHAAESDDHAAQTILLHGAAELAQCVQATHGKLDWQDRAPRLAMTGGLVEGCDHYRTMIETAIRKTVPNCEIQPPQLPPTLGAAIIALQTLDIELTDTVIANLSLNEPRPSGSGGTHGQ